MDYAAILAQAAVRGEASTFDAVAVSSWGELVARALSTTPSYAAYSAGYAPSTMYVLGDKVYRASWLQLWQTIGSGDASTSIPHIELAGFERWTIDPARAGGLSRYYEDVDPEGRVTGRFDADADESLRNFVYFLVALAAIYAAGTAMTAAQGAGAGAGAAPSGATTGGNVNALDTGFDWGNIPGDTGGAWDFPVDAPVDSGGWGDWGLDFPSWDVAEVGMPVAPDFPIPEITIAPSSAGIGTTIVDMLGTIKTVTGAALSIASTVQAFQQAGGRVQDPTASNRAADCSTGMILTRDASGRVSASRPAVGVATMTADGGMIINRGDGTYECIGPDGQRATRRYSTGPGGSTAGTTGGGFAGIDQKTLLLGGAVLLGAMLVMKKR